MDQFFFCAGGAVIVGEITVNLTERIQPTDQVHFFHFFNQTETTMPRRASYLVYDKIFNVADPKPTSKADLINAYKTAYIRRDIEIFSETVINKVDSSLYENAPECIQAFYANDPRKLGGIPIVAYRKDAYFDMLDYLEKCPELTAEEVEREQPLPGQAFRNEFEGAIYSYFNTEAQTQNPLTTPGAFFKYEWEDYFSLFDFNPSREKTYILANYCAARDTLMNFILPPYLFADRRLGKYTTFYEVLEKIIHDPDGRENVVNELIKEEGMKITFADTQKYFKKFDKAAAELHKLLVETGQEEYETEFQHFYP